MGDGEKLGVIDGVGDLEGVLDIDGVMESEYEAEGEMLGVIVGVDEGDGEGMPLRIHIAAHEGTTSSQSDCLRPRLVVLPTDQ